jgi:hypothetical protein
VAAVVADVSCIPDLPDGTVVAPDASPDAVSPEGASPEAGVVPVGCGDGFIDLAAGEQCDPGPTGRGLAVAGCNPDCTIQCDTDAGYLWPKNNHCYELAPALATRLYIGADRQVCGALPGTVHVATFASEDEFRSVAQHVDAGWFWVGLQETSNNNDYTSFAEFEPGWAIPCTGCYVHTTDPTTGLPPGKATGTGGLYCVQASSNLAEQSWRMVPCSGLSPGLSVICEREPVGTQARLCKAGTCIDLVWTLGTKSYVYGVVPLSASDAELTCAVLGGRLVVLGSRDEREQLWKQLSKLTVVPTALWIGLSQAGAAAPGDGGPDGAATADATATGPWTWDDDAAVSAYPSAWAYARPTPAANHATRAYLLKEEPPGSDDTLARNDGPMPQMLPYVCEVPADAGAPPIGDP